MRIELDPNKSMGQSTLKLSHNGEASFWDVSAYYQRSGDKTPALEESMIFDEINAYWASLNPERQQLIWQTYQQAREILDTHYDIVVLMPPLQQIAKQLYDLMPLSEINYWARFQGIRMPTTLKDQYDPRDIPEQTYLRHDYQGLVVLAIALRPMLPIWGEFISSTSKEAGNAFKELQALKLLKRAAIMESEPMQRLIVYVNAFIERSQQQALSSAALLSGLGTSEMPNWVLGLTVVRRLTVGQISAKDDNTSLISNVHQYIQNNLKSLDRKVGVQKFGGTGKVVDKKKPDQNPEDQKASVVELYKVKQEVPDGALVTLNVASENIQAMVETIDPTLPLDKLQACLKCVATLENLAIEAHQIVLAQWIVNPYMSALGVPHLSKPALMRVLAITQAALWHWGFHDLAALATATPLTVAGQDEMRSGLEGRARIPKEQLEEMIVRWPHHRIGKGKQVTARMLNVASRAVDKFCALVEATDWQLHGPAELLELSSRFPNTKRLTAPHDIRAQVGKLLLSIAN
jgi:hypothetical protein